MNVEEPFARFKHIPTVQPDFNKLRTLINEDCNSVKFRKYKDLNNRSIWIAGINEEGQICPEEVWTGTIGVKGRGYSGSTLKWDMEDGEVISLKGPGRAAPSFLLRNTSVEESDVRPSPSAVILYLREVRPWSDPVRKRTGQLHRKKYVYADEDLNYKSTWEREVMVNFLKKYPTVYEICHETLTRYGGGSGCTRRQHLIK